MSRCTQIARLGAPLLLTGCDVQTAEPGRLWLLWLVPALLGLELVMRRRAQTRLESFASPRALRRLLSGPGRGIEIVRGLLLLTAIVGLVLALARVQWGSVWEDIERRGVDIVVAIDVSDSMLVEDADQGGGLSRLDRAKREIFDLLGLLEGDRVGLVAFSGSAFVECPLTTDYGAAAMFLDAIDGSLIPVKGTSLAAAIESSLDALASSKRGSGAILLITDGEDHGGGWEKLAARAHEEGVRIFAVGIGRESGAPVPDVSGGFRRDRGGEIILSRLNESTLQRLALDSGGSYVRSVTGDLDLLQIYRQGIKASLEDRELASQRRRSWVERFQWMLALAIGCLMIEPFLRGRARG